MGGCSEPAESTRFGRGGATSVDLETGNFNSEDAVVDLSPMRFLFSAGSPGGSKERLTFEHWWTTAETLSISNARASLLALYEECRQAALQCHYRPRKVNGKPQEMVIEIAVHFMLVR